MMKATSWPAVFFVVWSRVIQATSIFHPTSSQMLRHRFGLPPAEAGMNALDIRVFQEATDRCWQVGLIVADFPGPETSDTSEILKISLPTLLLEICQGARVAHCLRLFYSIQRMSGKARPRRQSVPPKKGLGARTPKKGQQAALRRCQLVLGVSPTEWGLICRLEMLN